MRAAREVDGGGGVGAEGGVGREPGKVLGG